MTTAVPQLAPPTSLTAGIPTPEQIATQKAQFAAALYKQLKDAIDTIKQETAIEKDMVNFTAQKQIAMYKCQVDEKLVEMQALADEQATISQLELKKAWVERGLQLDSQAQGLAFDYMMRSEQQKLAQAQYQFEQQYLTAENKLAQEFAKQMAVAGPANLGAPGNIGLGFAAPSYVAAPTYAAPMTTAAPVSYAAPMTTAAPVSYAAPVTTAAAPTYAAARSYAAPVTTAGMGTVTTAVAPGAAW